MTLKQIHNIDFTPEIRFQTARSGGAGGQHVNKVETKVILRFSVTESDLFTVEQKARIALRLKNQINQEGELIIHSQDSRSQTKNKVDAVKKLKRLLYEALKVEKRRKPTKPSKAQKEARLKSKKVQAEKKANRGKVSY